MFAIYRNKKKSRIDGFFVVCASKEDTGLPIDILLDSRGSSKRFAGCPRIGVIVGDVVIPVSISDSPQALSGSEFSGSKEVYEWVEKNREYLLQHWNKEISDLEVLRAVSL